MAMPGVDPKAGKTEAVIPKEGTTETDVGVLPGIIFDGREIMEVVQATESFDAQGTPAAPGDALGMP